MANRPLVTVVGATGAQGGAVVKSLVETGKYRVILFKILNWLIYRFLFQRFVD